VIESVTIRGFKRFANSQLRMAPLTILTGLNGSGKTSLIQAILLAAEASRRSDNALPLNGPFGLELGTAADILNWGCKPPVEIEMQSSESGASNWSFEFAVEEQLFLGVSMRPGMLPDAFVGSPRSFTYLSAERLGPRDLFSTSSLPDHQLEVGFKGEYTAHVLSVLGDKVLEDANRVHPSRLGSTPELLKYEVEAWIREIAKPVEINAERLGTSPASQLSFRSPGGERVKSPNMGFGVSYSLPIVLGGLIAAKGGLMIVENPEAHLHPAGQSRVGAFLAWLSSKGVQVLVETHSDHVLNGIRRAIVDHKYVQAESVRAHFFKSNPNAAEDDPSPVELTFSDSGGLSDWPDGFFDQYQIDVSTIGRLRRNRTTDVVRS
jgi:predicted ATPase